MDFEFDCPRNFIDLHKCNRNSLSVEYDPWFQIYHPEHDEEMEPKTTNQPPLKNQSNSDKLLKSNRSQYVDKKSMTTSKDDLEKEIHKFNQKRARPEQRPNQQLNRNNRGRADDKENNAVVATVSTEEELQRINSIFPDTRTIAPIRSFHMPHVSTGSEQDIQLISSQTIMQSKLEAYKLSKAEKQKAALPRKTTHPMKNQVIKKVKSDKQSEEELMSLLKKHNNQFSKSRAYEPSRHSVRDVRAWEKLTGKVWANLTMEDREHANAEILALKQKG